MSMPMATESQRNFMATLLRDREVPAELMSESERQLTVREASNLISALTRLPRRGERPTSDEPLREGVYRLPDGTVVRVQIGKGSGKPYAKALVQVNGRRLNEGDDVVHYDYEYRPGLVQRVRAQDRLTLDEAKALSIKYGHCLWCGKRLCDAKSVELGIGPVCRKKFA